MIKISIPMDSLTLSHELRIPLTEILGMTEILKDDNLTTSQKEEVDLIRQAGYRLLNAVDAILTSPIEETAINKLHTH